MKVLFIAGFGPVTDDVTASRRLYEDAMGLPLKTDDGEYLHTDEIDGGRYFAVWPLSHAAQSCFGKSEWPGEMARPQAWIEFDVEDIEAATRELETRGYELLVRAREEPWGQTVTRLQSPEGLLVGLTITPSQRDKKS
jgi:catechol 2,3-dioxygenase-like lactoylglutathione lyase family enzyme